MEVMSYEGLTMGYSNELIWWWRMLRGLGWLELVQGTLSKILKYVNEALVD